MYTNTIHTLYTAVYMYSVHCTVYIVHCIIEIMIAYKHKYRYIYRLGIIDI